MMGNPIPRYLPENCSTIKSLKDWFDQLSTQDNEFAKPFHEIEADYQVQVELFNNWCPLESQETLDIILQYNLISICFSPQ